MSLQRVGVLAHPLRQQSYSVAENISLLLKSHGIEAPAFTDWTAESVLSVVRECDAVVAIGGDGAMLRAARVCAPFDVPILGVNMGYLGFLTEVETEDGIPACIDRLHQGEYWLEKRLMLKATVYDETGSEVATGEALNDIVISGNAIGRMTHLEAYIDGHWTTNYNADALVVSTATGSTAYALSCGGPILPPELNNILLIPAAPHLSMSRPIVLSEGARVDIAPTQNNRNPVLIHADGVELGAMELGGKVSVHASEHVTRFIRFRERNYFYRSLLDRLEPRHTA
jgi:NAD+ kinase